MDVARQENGEHQFDADRTGRPVWHERLVRKWDIPQLGGVRMFGCIDCAIHVKVRLNYGYGIECVAHGVLVQLLHVSWMTEAMLVICYDFTHIMIDGDTYLFYPVRNTIQNDVLFSAEYE